MFEYLELKTRVKPGPNYSSNLKLIKGSHAHITQVLHGFHVAHQMYQHVYHQGTPRPLLNSIFVLSALSDHYLQIYIHVSSPLLLIIIVKQTCPQVPDNLHLHIYIIHTHIPWQYHRFYIMNPEFEPEPPLTATVTEDEVVRDNTYKGDAHVIDKESSKSSSSIVRDVCEWRRKDLSLLVLAVATAIYVVLQVYHFRFIPLLSYAAIFIFTSAFIWGNLLRLFGKLVLAL